MNKYVVTITGVPSHFTNRTKARLLDVVPGLSRGDVQDNEIMLYLSHPGEVDVNKFAAILHRRTCEFTEQTPTTLNISIYLLSEHKHSVHSFAEANAKLGILGRGAHDLLKLDFSKQVISATAGSENRELFWLAQRFPAAMLNYYGANSLARILRGDNEDDDEEPFDMPNRYVWVSHDGCPQVLRKHKGAWYCGGEFISDKYAGPDACEVTSLFEYGFLSYREGDELHIIYGCVVGPNSADYTQFRTITLDCIDNQAAFRDEYNWIDAERWKGIEESNPNFADFSFSEKLCTLYREFGHENIFGTDYSDADVIIECEYPHFAHAVIDERYWEENNEN